MRDADVPVLEQLLRTTVPPAAMTADYRQRVVRSALKAREQVVFRRRRRGLLLAAVCAGWMFVIPCALLPRALPPPSPILAHEGQLTLLDPMLNSSPVAVDGYESALIQAQWQVRLQIWRGAQYSGNPRMPPPAVVSP